MLRTEARAASGTALSMRFANSVTSIDTQRRRLLLGASALAGLVFTGSAQRILAQPRFSSYPFTLGVASGDPTPDGFVLWTRLAPEPLTGGGMPALAIAVDWIVALDEKMTRVVQRGSVDAEPEWAHSVHVEVEGLLPDRWYWYQFRVGGEVSMIGRTRTAPLPGAAMQRLRFAVASCQHFEQGYFSAYRHMLDDDLDFVMHVGDYIYEGSWGEQIRRHEGAGAVTLDQYRNRHACYKTDMDLQRAHQAYPWLLTWDDHEVENDYAADVSSFGESTEDFVQRRVAAYRAYYEHMPLRARSRPQGRQMLMYSQVSFGDLANFQMIDDRQYRAAHACATPGHNEGLMVSDCAQRYAANQTMLGTTQERWLFDNLSNSRARWNVIGQQTLMAPFESRQDNGEYAVWTEGWDGYASARSRLLNHIADHEVRNAIVLGGDVHAFYVADLKTDFYDQLAPTIATEFVGTSITSHDVDYASIMRDLPHNPHIRYFDSRWRGYLRCEVTPQLWRSDLQIVDDVSDKNSSGRTLVSLVVEDGRPGAQPA